MSNLDDLINRIRTRPTAEPNAMLDEAVEALERLKGALTKIGSRWPCNSVETMSRLARETIGMKATTE